MQKKNRFSQIPPEKCIYMKLEKINFPLLLRFSTI